LPDGGASQIVIAAGSSIGHPPAPSTGTGAVKPRARLVSGRTEYNTIVGASDLPRNGNGHIGPDELDFRKVIEPVNTQGVAVLKQKHRIRSEFRPGEQEQMENNSADGGERIKSRKREVTSRTPPAEISPHCDAAKRGVFRIGQHPGICVAVDHDTRFTGGGIGNQ